MNPLFFSGQPGTPSAKGAIGDAKITLKPNPGREIRVAVFEEFSGGSGAQWRAAVWMASFVSTMLVNRDLTD